MRALILALLALIIAPAPALPQTEPFRVLNQTEQSAHSLFAVRTGRPDWGANMLTRGPLAPGAAFGLRPAALIKITLNDKLCVRWGHCIDRYAFNKRHGRAAQRPH